MSAYYHNIICKIYTSTNQMDKIIFIIMWCMTVYNKIKDGSLAV